MEFRKNLNLFFALLFILHRSKTVWIEDSFWKFFFFYFSVFFHDKKESSDFEKRGQINLYRKT
ncbi:hypothetical protein EGX98_06380 [Fusobacterium necrophorum]|nr:hypothetical protein EGX98_06380 [Fusobacterium necrophorum]AZW10271.1 hypothetical protein EO219_01000 [Fusobacterium necrophorum subsp. necrophorum]